MISFTAILLRNQEDFLDELSKSINSDVNKEVAKFVNLLNEGVVYNKVRICSVSFSSLTSTLHLDNSNKEYWLRKISSLIIQMLTIKLKVAGICDFKIRASGSVEDDIIDFWVVDE